MPGFRRFPDFSGMAPSDILLFSVPMARNNRAFSLSALAPLSDLPRIRSGSFDELLRCELRENDVNARIISAQGKIPKISFLRFLLCRSHAKISTSLLGEKRRSAPSGPSRMLEGSAPYQRDTGAPLFLLSFFLTRGKATPRLQAWSGVHDTVTDNLRYVQTPVLPETDNALVHHSKVVLQRRVKIQLMLSA